MAKKPKPITDAEAQQIGHRMAFQFAVAVASRIIEIGYRIDTDTMNKVMHALDMAIYIDGRPILPVPPPIKKRTKKGKVTDGEETAQ